MYVLRRIRRWNRSDDIPNDCPRIEFLTLVSLSLPLECVADLKRAPPLPQRLDRERYLSASSPYLLDRKIVKCFSRHPILILLTNRGDGQGRWGNISEQSMDRRLRPVRDGLPPTLGFAIILVPELSAR